MPYFQILLVVQGMAEDYLALVISNLLVIFFFLFFLKSKKKASSIYKDRIIELLQKTEAVLHKTNVQSLQVPSVSVSTTITASSGSPSVTNQEAELALLRRILARMTAVREAFNQN